MKMPYFIPLLIAAAIYGSCHSQEPAAARKLADQFPDLSVSADTVHLFLQDSLSGHPISDTLLKATLDSTQYANLHFDTGDAHYQAVGKFQIADGMDFCLVQTEESWFKKLTALVYDRQQQKILTTLEVALFYGGEGGQVAVESWVFRKKTPLQVFIKNEEHGFSLQGDAAEPKEYQTASGRLWQWQPPVFKEMTNPDSALLLQKLSMRHTW